jgi:hypothetical protein
VRPTVRWASLAVVACLSAGPAWAQARSQTLDLQGLQQPARAPLTLTPTFTVTEEYNDNILLDNRDKRWDLITGFTPGLALNWESPVHRLNAAYSFTSEIYARNHEFDDALARQNFTLDSFYRFDPTVTVSLTDVFTSDNNTNAIGREGIATGRTRSYGNTLAPGVVWRIDDVWTSRTTASYTTERFSGGQLQNSTVYRIETDLDRRITTRLTGTAGYEFEYIDVQPDRATVHTPRVGFSYQITETITVAANGGPAFVLEERHSMLVTPVARATYTQRVFFGSFGFSFDRSIGVAGGLGGPTEDTSVGGTVRVTTLLKGLVLSFAPTYTIAKSTDIDERAVTVPLQATYRVTPWLALVGAYQFFRQRSGSTGVGTDLATDADQNRVSIGLQFGYPIPFN